VVATCVQTAHAWLWWRASTNSSHATVSGKMK